MRHMRLKEGKNNRTYIVEEIHIELNLERRLEALGLKMCIRDRLQRVGRLPQ